MSDVKKIGLPSGAELAISLAPFADSKALYQAVLEELKSVSIDPDQEIDVNLFKDLFCVGFSSKKIESALLKCIDRCTYDGKKIDKDTFEPVGARGDYMKVCIEVVKENILPFVKDLSAEYLKIMAQFTKSPA